MLYNSARVMKFIFLVAMMFFGATSIPRLMFVLFLGVSGAGLPPGVKEIVIGFVFFLLATAGFIGISAWLRKQESPWL